MKPLLVSENRSVLEQVAATHALIAFDFDGTLAPIVPDRDRAAMRPETEALFRRCCELFPCAVISGRRKDDLLDRLRGIPVKYIVGNHGMEPGAGLGQAEREMAAVREQLAESLGSVAGLDIEDKRYSLAVHYRRSRARGVARAAVLRAVARSPHPLRVIPGKLVVNVLPADAADKGLALLELRAREHAHTALYVGDDVTDEDVFRIDQPGRLLSVRVGESGSSAASYFVRSQRHVDRLLRAIIAFREREARTHARGR